VTQPAQWKYGPLPDGDAPETQSVKGGKKPVNDERLIQTSKTATEEPSEKSE
jgi:hypothetical protein